VNRDGGVAFDLIKEDGALAPRHSGVSKMFIVGRKYRRIIAAGTAESSEFLPTAVEK
jgi:hypothetical protein